LYGTALMRAGTVVAESAPGTDAGQVLVAALDASIGGIQQLGKATRGEKTMLDALVPATEAGRAAMAEDSNAADVAAAMAEAADAGAASTIPMLATKGRASYLGERSVGHQDPGATSSALLLRALADTVAGAR
jgi:dihydroxyacetone kinase-like protein